MNIEEFTASGSRRFKKDSTATSDKRSPGLLTFLHMAFPVGGQHLFFDGWLGAPNPTIESVMVVFATGSITAETFVCSYIDRPDLERVKKKAARKLRFTGYRLLVKLPGVRTSPQRVIFTLADGEKLSQSLAERYTADVTTSEKLNYLQTTPYSLERNILENSEYVETVLRLCTQILTQSGSNSSSQANTEQICCTESGLLMISGWMQDGGKISEAVTAVDSTTGKKYPASVLRFSRDDLDRLRNGSFGFALFLQSEGNHLPVQLSIAGKGESCAEISTRTAPVTAGASALAYTLDVLRQYLGSGVTTGFDPKDTGQESVIRFIDALKQNMRRGSYVSTEHQWGSSPESPDVTFVIPIYRSYHLIRNQLLDFSSDAFIKEQEIIYVLDSVEDHHRFVLYMNQLWELFRVPSRLLIMDERAGFAGASNAGARAARAERILFLNPDVFTSVPRSFQQLVSTLDSDPALGAVGARLVFPDGSLQHAGLTWKSPPGFGGLRTNHHFGKGVDSQSIEVAGVRDVPAVTAACMLCRKSDFEAAGGFDEGFLWGDYEDSDLCLRLRQLGKRVVCDNDAVFIHAEGTSYPSVERQGVMAYNALKHEQRWHREIDAILAAEQNTS